MKLREKNGTGTIELKPTDKTGGTIVHTDGGHTCEGAYAIPRPGQNLVGLKLAVVRHEEGTYETLDVRTGETGAKVCSGGPAQVATPAYRDHWEQTFGSRGGVS